jgi:hypothetical protein
MAFSSVEWAHPEIEFGFADGPEPGSRIGPAGMVDTWRNWLSAFGGLRTSAYEDHLLDDGRVFVLARFEGHAKTSGLDIGQVPRKQAALFQIRDGKVTRLTLYYDRDRALADLGLAPEGE